jgi:hypothetical protein
MPGFFSARILSGPTQVWWRYRNTHVKSMPYILDAVRARQRSLRLGALRDVFGEYRETSLL